MGTGTGPYGAVTVPTYGGGTVGDGIKSVFAWLNAPFTHPMNPTTVFLIVGVILVSLLAWNMILFHLRLAAQTLTE